MAKRGWKAAVVVGLACLGLTGVSRGAVIADSVAQFSGTQGQDGWEYGYYSAPFTPSTFEHMTFNSGEYRWKAYGWNQLWSEGGHPNTSWGLEQWAVRRYVAQAPGILTLTGNIADENPGGGNGIVGRIFVGDTEVYAALIDNGNTAGADYSVKTTVSAGTHIDFAIDPRNQDDSFDSTRFTAVITAVPEPGSFVLLACGAVVLGLRRMTGRNRSSADR